MTAPSTAPLSPRLQRAMEAAKARGLAVDVIPANDERDPVGQWVRIAHGRICIFAASHIISVDTNGSPELLVSKAQTWAEHAAAILAAADGVTT